MLKFEKPPEENLVEDVDAARAAAEAENPARSFLAEHRAELSEEQQKALEWFATSEGEKALANFAQEKEELKNLIREKAFNLLKIGPENRTGLKILSFLYKEDSLRETVLEELNNKVMPSLFEEQINGILAAKEDFAGKMRKIENLRRAFERGVSSVFEHKDILSLPTEEEEADKEAYFYGLLAPCLMGRKGKLVMDALEVAERRFGIDFDKLVKKLENMGMLRGAHENERFDKIMELHNYIFNPKKDRYEKVE